MEVPPGMMLGARPPGCGAGTATRHIEGDPGADCMQYKDAMGQVVPPISYKKSAALLLITTSKVTEQEAL